MKYISVYILSAAAVFAQSNTTGLTRGPQGPRAAHPDHRSTQLPKGFRAGPTAPGVQPKDDARPTPTGFTTGQAARLVIGQPTFTSQDSNSSDTILGGASGLAYAADTLFVADSNRVGASPSNHRVLLYQNLSGMLPRPTAPLTYNSKCPVCVGQATLVLGQPDFTTATENIPATPTTLRLPTAVASDGVHVVVADTNHNRVLIWNRIPTSNNAPADVVVGQPDSPPLRCPGNTPNAKSHARPAGSVDSERQALRGRHAEQPRPDLQPHSDQPTARPRTWCWDSPISRPSSSPT